MFVTRTLTVGCADRQHQVGRRIREAVLIVRQGTIHIVGIGRGVVQRAAVAVDGRAHSNAGNNCVARTIVGAAGVVIPRAAAGRRVWCVAIVHLHHWRRVLPFKGTDVELGSPDPVAIPHAHDGSALRMRGWQSGFPERQLAAREHGIVMQ